MTADAAAEVPAPPSHGVSALAWRRLRREKLAVASLLVLSTIVFACFVGGPS